MILAHSYEDAQRKYYHPDDVEEKDGRFVARTTGEILTQRVEKMSKSKLNVINPEDVIAQYGADAMRLYECFMGPLEGDRPWEMGGVDGVHRFLERAWRLVYIRPKGAAEEELNPALCDGKDAELEKVLHQSIQKITEDLEAHSFNTAIAQLMVFVNAATKCEQLPKEALRTFTQLLSPFAPHLAEELYEALGGQGGISDLPWPEYDAELVKEDLVEVPVQVNGKVRAMLKVPADATKQTLEEAALANDKVQAILEGKAPRKIIAVPGRIVSIVR
jgi:leucyl-tRNA synthetase